LELEQTWLNAGAYVQLPTQLIFKWSHTWDWHNAKIC